MSPLNPSVIVANELPYESVPSTITQLLAISSKSVTVCNNCKAIREKPDVSHIVDLTYPRRVR
jgi:PAB-dependent poly(A)-specific ribonuclease subunit 2